MSINVTVTGNPVQITRGKMVTSVPNEFDKRRKIRLQQVRSQAKEVAANVRKKVKSFKDKKQNEFEAKNQGRLKQLQNQKIAQLQNQYDNGLADIGSAHHYAAIDEQAEDEYIAKQQENALRAKLRGKQSEALLQVQKNEASLKKAIPIQTRQFSREIENVRSAMVVKQASNKKHVSRKKAKDQLIVTENKTISLENESKVEPVPANTLGTESGSTKSSNLKSAHSSPTRDKQVSPAHKTSSRLNDAAVMTDNTSMNIENIASEHVEHNRMRVGRSPTKSTQLQECLNSSDIEIVVKPAETRISDRIRSRILTNQLPNISEDPVISSSSSNDSAPRNSHPHQALLNAKHGLTHYNVPGVNIPARNGYNEACPYCLSSQTPHQPSCQIHNYGPVQNMERNAPIKECSIPAGSACPKLSKFSTQCIDIPPKPTVAIPRTAYLPQYSQQDVNSTSEYRKVKNVNRNRRFTQDYVVDRSRIERIDPEDLIYHHDSDESGARVEIADMRKKKAQERGKRAMAKEQIHNDYQELMRKLPMLQKQERLANLNPSKDQYHMNDERRKEFEQMKQQELEHAFERFAPAAITLQPKGRKEVTVREKPFISCQSKKENFKSIGSWTEENKENTQANKNDNDLAVLLQKLKNQKEELLKEKKQLPHDSNFYNLIDELAFVAKGGEIKTSENKTVQTKTITSPQKKRPKEVMHKAVRVLQNTSTQTSPKIIPDKSSSSDSAVKRAPSQKSTDKSESSSNAHAVCKCSADKLCEILIKICDSTGTIEHPIKVTANKISRSPPQTSREGRMNRLQETLNLESPLKKSKSSRGNAKRSRSESPRKTPRKQSPSKDEPSETKKGKKQPTPTGLPQDQIKSPHRDKGQKRLDSGIPTVERNTWKKYLSSNKHTDEMTSNTSYLSPPDYAKPTIKTFKGNLVYKKTDIKENLRPDLLSYIKRLLEISRNKFETVTDNISSVSEFGTPSSSVINAETNRPKCNCRPNDLDRTDNLSHLLKHVNLTQEDLKNALKSATPSSISSSRTRSPTNSSGSSSTRKQPVRFNIDETDGTLDIREEMASRFTNWADICQRRICKLSNMIEQVRQEKQQILSPTNEEFTTTAATINEATEYLNLPSFSGWSTSNSSAEQQRQLTEKMLDIRQTSTNFSHVKGTNINDLQQLLATAKDHPDLDADVVKRYMKLIEVELQTSQEKATNNGKIASAPMLDIPKLPKLPAQQSQLHSVEPKPRKPPITQNALRFNEVVHELSVIPEIETSRLSKSPQNRRSPQKATQKQRSPSKSTEIKKQTIVEVSSDSQSTSQESIESMLKDIGLEWAIPALKLSKSNNADSTSSSSSLDIDMKKFCFLVSRNISTSTEKSQVSPMGENSKHQRTSTPICTSNSSKSQRLINSAESELSPVAGTSGIGQPKSALKGKSKTKTVYRESSFTTVPSNSDIEDNDLS